jgi:hypothetical protein
MRGRCNTGHGDFWSLSGSGSYWRSVASSIKPNRVTPSPLPAAVGFARHATTMFFPHFVSDASSFDLKNKIGEMSFRRFHRGTLGKQRV